MHPLPPTTQRSTASDNDEDNGDGESAGEGERQRKRRGQGLETRMRLEPLVCFLFYFIPILLMTFTYRLHVWPLQPEQQVQDDEQLPTPSQQVPPSLQTRDGGAIFNMVEWTRPRYKHELVGPSFHHGDAASMTGPHPCYKQPFLFINTCLFS